MESQLSIINTFKVPFKSYKRTWYWLWLILAGLAIIGEVLLLTYSISLFWILLVPLTIIFVITTSIFLGYLLQVIKVFLNGKYNGLAPIASVKQNLNTGFWFFLYIASVTLVSFIVALAPYVGQLLSILWGLVVSIMTLQYVEHQNFGEGWDIPRALTMITQNFLPYIIMLLKSIGVGLLYILCMLPIITIPFLIGPSSFSKYILVSEFYRQYR